MEPLSDPSALKVLGEHWALVITIASILVGFAFVIRVVVVSLNFGRRVLQEEIHQGLAISLSNGVGKKVEALVQSGVSRAMQQHILDCPGRDRVNAQHERILALENAILALSKKDK